MLGTVHGELNVCFAWWFVRGLADNPDAPLFEKILACSRSRKAPVDERNELFCIPASTVPSTVGFLNLGDCFLHNSNFKRVSRVQFVPPEIGNFGSAVYVALDEPLLGVGVHGEPHVIDLLAGIVAEDAEKLVVFDSRLHVISCKQVVHCGQIGAGDQRRTS